METHNEQKSWLDMSGDDDKAVVKVSFKYHRMYFSVRAVRALGLENDSFKIFKRGKRWLLMKTASSMDLILKYHQHAYYITSKRLVVKLIRDFRHDNPSFVIDKADTNRRYYQLIFFDSPPKVRRQRTTERRRTRSEDPRITSSEKTVARFEQTNFPGRIKTREVLRAEQILNRQI